jgi:MarR family transcriptional regulator, transcriptional regulator for hemolysin
MPRPRQEPIGLYVTRTSKALSRAFDEALASAGGSLPVWLVLVSLKGRTWGTQRELAKALGIEGATLTHHLDAMERAGLVTRTRDPANRRVQRMELTEEGDAAFHRMREAAVAFDERLRSGLDEADIERTREVLARLRANVSERPLESPPLEGSDP